MNSIFQAALAGLALGTALVAASQTALAGSSGAPTKNNTLSVEFAPEWKTSNGNLADDYIKLGLTHAFSNNVVAGTSFQYQWRPDSTSVDQAEVSLGYKIKAGAFTLTPGVLLGYGFGDAPKINPQKGHGGDAEAYYAATLAADLKLNDSLTWNVFNARYRNAFNVTWITPKVSTGLTLKLNSDVSLYSNVGYAWKDSGSGLQGDKWNVVAGVKFSF